MAFPALGINRIPAADDHLIRFCRTCQHKLSGQIKNWIKLQGLCNDSKSSFSNVICRLGQLENLIIDYPALCLLWRATLQWSLMRQLLWPQSGNLGQMSCCAEWMEVLPSVESQWDDTGNTDNVGDKNRLLGTLLPLLTSLSVSTGAQSVSVNTLIVLSSFMCLRLMG